MKLYKFKLSDIAILIVLFLAGYFFTETQKYWVPAVYRIYAYIAMVAILYSVIFELIAPKKPYELANSLCVAFGGVVIAIILVQDVWLMHQVSWRTLIIYLAVIVIPYFAAGAYGKIKR